MRPSLGRAAALLASLLAAACAAGAPEAPCSTPDDCPGIDDACRWRTCTGGACGQAAAADSTPLPVQVAGDCQRQVCLAGSAIQTTDAADVPDDGNLCTIDACAGHVPTHAPVTRETACGSGSVCDGAGQCVGCLVATDCPGEDGTCSVRSCNAGTCGLAARADGTACDDGNPATASDACRAGVCTGVDRCAGVTCLPAGPCQDATCDAATGACRYTTRPMGSACDDGDVCTDAERCIGTTCQAGLHLACGPPDQCHAAIACHPVTGCANPPVVADGTPCDDQNPATTGETCRSGVCTSS